MVPPVIHDTALSIGHSGKAHDKARLKQIAKTEAASMNHPAARLAGYQTSSDERVFGVLKPYAPLGGTLPRIIGMANNRTTRGTTPPITTLVTFAPYRYAAAWISYSSA